MDNLYGGIGTTRVRRDISVGQHGTCYRRVVTHPGDITQELKVIYSEVTCDIFGALALKEVVLLNRRKYVLFWKRTLGGRVGGGEWGGIQLQCTQFTIPHPNYIQYTQFTIPHSNYIQCTRFTIPHPNYIQCTWFTITPT